MKFYIFLSILLLANYVSGEDCGNIKPTQPSDCVLSSKDKTYYKFCCYDIGLLGAKCTPFSEATKELLEESLEDLGIKNENLVCNKSSYIKLGFLLFILFFIF